MSAEADGRLRFLDGVRGLASLQVLINHVLLAFSPGAELTAGLVADADLAVMLFFVMSGFVLTESYERQKAGPARVVIARFVRLALPVAAACLFGYALLLALPQAHSDAGALAGSGFLLGKSVASPTRALADILGITMWTGTSNTTLFAPLARLLPGTESSVDAPIWSMHLELWGSMMVLGLVIAARARRGVLAMALLVSALLAGATAMALFVCGFLLAKGMRSSLARGLADSRAAWIAAVLLIGGGLMLTGHGASGGAAAFDPSRSALLQPYEWYRPLKALAALMIFCGLLALPPLQRGLAARPFAWLGRLSYSIYLLHMPILLTLGSLTFVAFGEGQRAVALAAAIAVVLLTTLPLAAAFESRIDRRAVELSRLVRS